MWRALGCRRVNGSFSRADSRLIASSGNATSISLRLCTNSSTLNKLNLADRSADDLYLKLSRKARQRNRNGSEQWDWEAHQNGCLPLAQVLAQWPRTPVASKSPRSVVANGSSRYLTSSCWLPRGSTFTSASR